MGKKGERRSGVAKVAAEELVERLSALGDVRSRGMFGGFGIFTEDAMFALVDSKGAPHLRATGELAEALQAHGAARHGKMPYYAIPAEILDADEELLGWAKNAAASAIAAKRE